MTSKGKVYNTGEQSKAIENWICVKGREKEYRRYIESMKQSSNHRDDESKNNVDDCLEDKRTGKIEYIY